MPFLFGDHRLEKIGLAKTLHFNLNLTLNSGAVPTLASVSAPASAAVIGLVTANGAGTLLPGVTFASLAGTSATAPVIGVEIADGMVTATGGIILVKGNITAVTGASNVNLGSPVYGTAFYVSGGAGVAFNLTIGLAGTITGLAQSISASSGTATLALDVVYFDR